MQNAPSRPALQTARLCLRTPHPDDAEALATLTTPAISQRVATWPVPFTQERAQARIADALAAIGGGNTLVYVVEHQGSLVGWIGGGSLPNTRRASFGFWLGEPYHGQAFMREAAPAFVAALRAYLDVHSVEAACQPGNHASARVLAACGLHRIGARCQHAPARNRDELVDIWEHVWPGPPQRSNLSR